MPQCLPDGVRTIARHPEILMSIAVFVYSGFAADTGVTLCLGWDIAAALLGASHAKYRDTRYRRRDPI
jgi:hypothetical protein